MPSSVNTGPKYRSPKVSVDALRGIKWRVIPDLIIPTGVFAAADLTGANSGFYVFTVPFDMWFLEAQFIWATAGTNTARVKKVLAAATNAAGAAADASNVDISSAAALNGTANTVVTVTPVTTGAAHFLAAGDKIAIASAAGTASLAGARGWLRLVAD